MLFRSELATLGTVIYLQITPEEVISRLSGDNTRPLLSGDDPEQKVRDLLTYRTPLYERVADLTIPATGQSPEYIAEEIISRM